MPLLRLSHPGCSTYGTVTQILNSGDHSSVESGMPRSSSRSTTATFSCTERVIGEVFPGAESGDGKSQRHLCFLALPHQFPTGERVISETEASQTEGELVSDFFP